MSERSARLAKLKFTTIDHLANGEASDAIDMALQRAVADLANYGSDGLARKVVIEVTLKQVPGRQERFKAGVSAKTVLPRGKVIGTVGYLEREAGSILALFSETSADNPDQLAIPFAEEPAAAPVPAPKVERSKPAPVNATWDEITAAVVAAARVLGEYGEEQFAELNDLADACANGPVVQALRLVARTLSYELLMRRKPQDIAVLQVQFPMLVGENVAFKSDGDRLAEIATWPAERCLAFLVQLAAVIEMGVDGPNTDVAHEILDFAELDWQQLVEQARRQIAGEPTAEQKLTAIEAAEEPEPDPKPAKKGRKKAKVS